MENFRKLILTKFVRRLRARVRKFKSERKLKKYNCKNWAEYGRRYDPDVSFRSSRVSDFYYGYPYVHCFENRDHQIYWWDLAYDGSQEIVEWCEEQCKDKFRFDGLRVIKVPATAWQWEMNELGGGDYYFAAFKNEKDFFSFMLKWA